MDTNCLHITGTQAVKLLRAARAGDLVSAKPCDCTHVQSLDSTVASLDDFGAGELFSWLCIGPQNPLHTLSPSPTSRTWITGIKSKVLSADLPPGSFMELCEGSGARALKLPSSTRVLIDSPELALLHACDVLGKKASKFTLGELEVTLRLIALASEFCGSYARDPLKPQKARCHYDDPRACGRFTTPERMTAYVAAAPLVWGLKRARRIVRYAIDESGSPMETFVNCALTLPPRLGGLSMVKPLANKQLVEGEGGVAPRLKHDSLRPDFQWPEFKLLAEYLGEGEHASLDARREDKNRLQDYMVSNYKAFFLMFDDVRSASALNQTALTLAGEFAKGGKKNEPYRLRRLMKDPAFCEKQTKLVSTLLPPLLRYAEG